jgi:hypothetical protein
MPTKKILETIGKISTARAWLYLALALLLVGCLWVGWHDFDPYIPQEVIRENIRSSTRRTIQITIQYIIPLAVLVFFIREITAKRRSKQ